MLEQRQRMDYFAQQLINGIVLGSIYGLIAIGYTMVYGIVGMINFAHGDIFMIGGFIALISFQHQERNQRNEAADHDDVAVLETNHITAVYDHRVDRIAHRSVRHSLRQAPCLPASGM